MGIGVCQITSNFHVNDANVLNKIQYGSLTDCNFKVYLGSVEGHLIERNNIKDFAAGDMVEVEYDYMSKRVKVRNETKDTESVSYIQICSISSLYMAVNLYNKDDEV